MTLTKKEKKVLSVGFACLILFMTLNTVAGMTSHIRHANTVWIEDDFK